MSEQKFKVALVDCNNFYASCERVFNPRLENRPVIILSNNDGCAVARSNEAKALGIPMGAPFHKIRNVVQKHDVQVFSSNYELYGDLSARVMRTLEEMAFDVEIYSIDEAFLNFSGFSLLGLEEHCHKIKKTVRRNTGIPVSIGIGPSKTLAKIANRLAKKNPRTRGVLDISEPRFNKKALEMLRAGDVWGVGSRWARKLEDYGIYTAAQLRDADIRWIEKKFNVVMGRTVLELRGIPSIGFAEPPKSSQSITSSRSFGKKVTAISQLKEAVASYTAKAAEKLRARGLLTNVISVFITTSRFSPADSQYQNSASITLPEATSDSTMLIHYAFIILDTIYREGYRYHKAGIMLLDVVPIRGHQPSLFGDSKKQAKNSRLMKTIDLLNKKMGSNTVRFGAQGIKHEWRMRRERKSAAYTTCWKEIPVIQAV
ncbi:MAG: Y-family DNA polymerase [Magnetococcales bacterium]|nr:Y-family DNA polymerase [Magnetococcales bacterium]